MHTQSEIIKIFHVQIFFLLEWSETAKEAMLDNTKRGLPTL